MRTLALIALTGLVLTAGALDAEARGLRLRLGAPRLRQPPAAAVHAIPRGTAPAPGLAIRLDRSVAGRPTYVVLPSPLRSADPAEARPAAEPAAKAVEAPAPAPEKAAAEAAPWCRSQRVVGTGTGFCLIN